MPGMSDSGPAELAAMHPAAHAPVQASDPQAWGRIAEDGTVYLRTPEGERVIGSWQAGTTDEGLAYYSRKYDDLAAEVSVLEGRLGAPTADAKAVATAARK